MIEHAFSRRHVADLLSRLREPRRFIQVLSGARQVGKTTVARQVAERSGLPVRYASADEPTLRDAGWITAQWEAARLLVREPGADGALLILDEVQNVTGWSDVVTGLWDADSFASRPLKVVLLGSAPLLVQRGLGDSGNVSDETSAGGRCRRCRPSLYLLGHSLKSQLVRKTAGRSSRK